jgi:DNA-binding transcriptional LysR family regulator
MDLRSLSHFVMVADELHFSRAAKRLFITQPGLSQSIKALEHEIGLALFERSRQHVRLTPAGEAFLPQARELLAHAEEISRFAKSLAASRRETLVISHTRSAGLGIPTAMLSAFRNKYPRIAIKALNGFSSLNVERAQHREVDVAFVRPPIDNLEDLELSILYDDAVVVALPEGHRLAVHDRIDAASIANEPLVFFSPDAGGLWKATLDAVYGPQHRPPIVRLEPDESHMLAAVADGAGISLITEPAAAMLSVPGVVVRPLLKHARVPIGIVWRTDNANPALSTFLSFVRKFMSTRAKPP